MIKSKLFIFLIPISFIVTLSAFHPGSASYKAQSDDRIKVVLPANFPEPVYNFKANAVTEAGFLLGKTLFYDAALSADKSVSCGSCHQASAAFANLGSAVSRGINNCNGTRNAPALFNMVWQKEYMWDGRINAMNLVPINALTSKCEMGNSMDNVLKTLQADAVYPQLFEQAFGTAKITQANVLNALSQFTAMLISANSKYDRLMRKEPGVAFTADERAGYALFKQKCSTCHTEPLFTDYSYRNNGLDLQYKDIGRDSLTHIKADVARFKVPTLRNIEITGPYMHDGRFYSLKEVLRHYASGMQNHDNLDTAFKTAAMPGIPLTPIQQTQVITFLKTLTDVNFINDRRFNNH